MTEQQYNEVLKAYTKEALASMIQIYAPVPRTLRNPVFLAV